MAEFIVRARSGPTRADSFRAAIGQGHGVEFLADIVRHTLFVAQGHRQDAVLHLVLEKSQDFSRVVSLTAAELGSVGDLHEVALLELIACILAAGETLGKNETAVAGAGLQVQAISFEHLVRDKAAGYPTYVLSPKGSDIRETPLTAKDVYVMTDHTPMPKNTFKSMARQGVKRLSLGPQMLHAAQCITLIHNERDRRC